MPELKRMRDPRSLIEFGERAQFYYGYLAGICREQRIFLFSTDESVDDAAQEAFLAAWTGFEERKSTHHGRNFREWLRALAIKACEAQIEASLHRHEVEVSLPQKAAKGFSLDPYIEQLLASRSLPPSSVVLH
jgi:DNA-directed RNA polymerase specialized sigma24 family protein